MTTLIICSDFYHDEIDEIKKKYPKIRFVESNCEALKESQPVIFRVPEGRLYHHVTSDRLIDVVSGHGDDLLIQTGGLFSVEMKCYVSEPKFRRLVKLFKTQLVDLEEYSKKSIEDLLDDFAKENKIAMTDIINPLKVALIRTTKGPDLPIMIEVLGKNEVMNRIKKYLRDYKNRI